MVTRTQDEGRSAFVVARGNVPLPAALVTIPGLLASDHSGRKVRFAARVVAVRKDESTVLVEAEGSAVRVDCALCILGDLRASLPDVADDLIIMGDVESTADAPGRPAPVWDDHPLQTVSLDRLHLLQTAVVRAILLRRVQHGLDVGEWDRAVGQDLSGSTR